MAHNWHTNGARLSKIAPTITPWGGRRGADEAAARYGAKTRPQPKKDS